MSFSSIVKNEMGHVEVKDYYCRLSQLAGEIRAGILLNVKDESFTAVLTTENAVLSRNLYSLFKDIFKQTIHVDMKRTKKLKKHILYSVDFTKYLDKYSPFLKKLGIVIDQKERRIFFSPMYFKNTCCKKSYLRGIFMSAGSMTNPDRGYHLEITCHYKFLAEELKNVMEDFGISPKTVKRKGYTIVYLKEGQDIADFLNITGAHHALIELENIRIVKDMRNKVNRIVNCETANLEKTVSASFKQLENIRLIEKKMGIHKLSSPLQEIAYLRLKYPDVSLAELGSMLSPPLSKSGVNHRFRKIKSIAEKLN